MSYIANSMDYNMSDEEYDAYESFMKQTYMCPLCECTHWSINGKKHQQCQMPEGY